LNQPEELIILEPLACAMLILDSIIAVPDRP
jgi:hypothetical protein